MLHLEFELHGEPHIEPLVPAELRWCLLDLVRLRIQVEIFFRMPRLFQCAFGIH